MQLSASSAALDLATSQSPGPDSNGWGASFARHRPTASQASLPIMSNSSAAHSNGPESPMSVRPSYSRHSLDLKSFDQDSYGQITSPSKHVPATPPKLQQSYSANDVPTMRNATANGGNSSVTTTPNSHAQQHLHNHNASLGRIPPNAMNNRLSRELNGAGGDTAGLREGQNGGYQSIQSALQASAPPFSLTQGSNPQAPAQVSMTPSSQPAQYATPFYNNYNMQLMTMGMQNMGIGQPMYSPHNPYVNYMYTPQTGVRDSQARVIQQRRQNDGEGKSTDFSKKRPLTDITSNEPFRQHASREPWW